MGVRAMRALEEDEVDAGKHWGEQEDDEAGSQGTVATLDAPEVPDRGKGIPLKSIRGFVKGDKVAGAGAVACTVAAVEKTISKNTAPPTPT